MKIALNRIPYLIATLLAFTLQLQGQSPSVEVRLRGSGLAASAEVFITGNQTELGHWNPAATKMEALGDQEWRIRFQLDSPGLLEYKFTRGSWDKEGTDDKGAVLRNFRAQVAGDTVLYDTVCCWLDGSAEKQLFGQVTGTLEHIQGLKPKGLPARDVWVWLPPDYERDGKHRYPVLYMHDGQNVFDPATSSFGVDWAVDETCDSLIRRGLIPAMIVVAVQNGPERRQEYSPGKLGTAYMDFLIHQLKPLIDSTYRSLPDREHTLVGGASMGGLISFMLAWEHPEVFSKAICMSPAFRYLDFDYLPTVRKYQGKRPKVRIYFDNGGLGLETVLQPGCDAMLKALREKGYREGKDFRWVHDPEAEHFEAAWAKRMPGALMWLMGK